MSECIDKQLGRLLHAYELGMLSEEESDALEVHMLECMYCNDKVRQLQNTCDLLRHSPELRDFVGHLDKNANSSTRSAQSEEAPLTKPSRRTSLLRAWAAVLIVLVIVLLKPWSFQLRPDDEAIATENRLAILYFDNLSDEEDAQRLGEIITSLLITDLSESQYMQVVSSQMVYDILNRMGMGPKQALDRDLATRVAREASARFMLVGDIIQSGQEMSISAQLIEVGTGTTIASQRVLSGSDETVFSIVDRLSIEVKNDLSLPLAARDEPDRMVADATTHSTEAYRHYLEGLESISKLDNPEALMHFTAALQYDSTFAMAYHQLSRVVGAEYRRAYAQKALNYADKACHKDQLFIRSRAEWLAGKEKQAISIQEELISRWPDEKYAYYNLGLWYTSRVGYAKAARYLEQAIKIDPAYRLALNQLAYTYDLAGEFDKAMGALDRYVAVAPDEPNPYDSRGELYARHGRFAEAKEAYWKAVKIKPDFGQAAVKLANLYLITGEYDSAAVCLRVWASNLKGADSIRVAGQFAIIAAYQGKFGEAIEILDQGIEDIRRLAGEAPESHRWAFPLICQRTHVKLHTSDGEQGLQELEQGFALTTPCSYLDSMDYLALRAYGLVQTGQAVRAEEGLAVLKSKAGDTRRQIQRYQAIAACHELNQGNYRAAVELASGAIEDIPVYWGFTPRFLLGRTYMKLGQVEEAVRILEQELNVYDVERVTEYVMGVQLYYYLGLAYERAGRYTEAANIYVTFLDIWKDADPGREEIDDARQRLNRLRNRP
ncbi:MAG: tetratricopeptide repeat protein [Candidatus Zixiibacteriota bacterium]|nr:MAG: tetratricopeptide repeat protein [candidate division Zixibacteria bacterium]